MGFNWSEPSNIVFALKATPFSGKKISELYLPNKPIVLTSGYKPIWSTLIYSPLLVLMLFGNEFLSPFAVNAKDES